MYVMGSYGPADCSNEGVDASAKKRLPEMKPEDCAALCARADPPCKSFGFHAAGQQWCLLYDEAVTATIQDCDGDSCWETNENYGYFMM